MQTLTDYGTQRIWDIVICQYLGLNKKASDKALKAIQRLRTPQSTALLYHLGHTVYGGPETIDSLLDGPLQPSRTVALIEELYNRGYLKRLEATTIQEAFLVKSNKVGEWKVL